MLSTTYSDQDGLVSIQEEKEEKENKAEEEEEEEGWKCGRSQVPYLDGMWLVEWCLVTSVME